MMPFGSLSSCRASADAFLRVGVEVSLPVPRLQAPNPTVGFLFYKATAREVDAEAPGWIVEVDVATQTIARNEAFVPGAWGLDRLPSACRRQQLVGASAEERQANRDQFIEAAEKLAPAFWDGAPVDSALRAHADRYLAWFPQLSESGMAEIYGAVGREWFTWLRAQAGGR